MKKAFKKIGTALHLKTTAQSTPGPSVTTITPSNNAAPALPIVAPTPAQENNGLDTNDLASAIIEAYETRQGRLNATYKKDAQEQIAASLKQLPESTQTEIKILKEKQISNGQKPDAYSTLLNKAKDYLQSHKSDFPPSINPQIFYEGLNKVIRECFLNPEHNPNLSSAFNLGRVYDLIQHSLDSPLHRDNTPHEILQHIFSYVVENDAPILLKREGHWSEKIKSLGKVSLEAKTIEAFEKGRTTTNNMYTKKEESRRHQAKDITPSE